MNQYRCETCKHNSGMPQRPCTLIFEREKSSLQIGIPFYMDILGCASHSDYNPQAEREKVLDLVCEILKHEWNNSNQLSREQKDERQIAVLHIRNQVAELRQKDGE